MIELPDKFKKHIPAANVKLGAVASIVLKSIGDPQSSESDWDSGLQLNSPIATTLSANINSTAATIPVASSDGFTSGSPERSAYIVVTDGANYEVIEYADIDGTNFKNAVRGRYGTTAQAWNANATAMQLLIDHGTSPEFDLAPQPRNWWTHLAVGATTPLQRIGHGWIFRPRDGCFYITGGYASDGNYKNDLWKFDPTTKAWTQLSPGGTAPTARAHASVVYAESHDEIWVFGGESGSPTQHKDLHKYSFYSGNWSTNANWDAPNERYASSSCWDSHSNKMIVAGGFKYFGQGRTVYDNCWTFNGSLWSVQKDMPVKLSEGDGCWMIAEKRFFVIGKTGGNAYRALAYNHELDVWEDASVSDPPTGKKIYPACCYDSASKKVLLFGGESSGAATNSLHAYGYAANEWRELASYKFDNGADKYSRHKIAWDTANNMACAWGGWNGSAPIWHTYAAPIYFRHFHKDAVFATQAMDVGTAPSEDGTWKIEDAFDFIGGRSSVSYAAEWSDDASQWTSLGTIHDGDRITQKHRYYRVTATFLCDADAAPFVQIVDAVFDEKIDFAMAACPLGSAAPIIKSVGAITSSIDPVKCTASIGALSIELIDTQRFLAGRFGGSYLAGKTINLKIGPIADDIDKSGFIDVFTGIVESWEYDGQVLKINARDFLGKLEKEIPEENGSGQIASLSYIVGGVATHPVDILLDILRNRIGVPDRHIHLGSFEEVKSDPAISNWAFYRVISAPTDAYELCLEICRLIGAILIPLEDGRISLKMLGTNRQPVATWNEASENFARPNFGSNTDLLRNFVSTWWHWNGSGDEWSDFEGAQIATDADSVANWGTRILRTKSKWLGDNASPYNGDQVALAISQRILDMAKEGFPTISFETHIGAVGVQVGDVVRIQSSILATQEIYLAWQSKYDPHRELAGGSDYDRSALPYFAPECFECVDMLWWVTRKRVDVNNGTIKWELMRLRNMPLEKNYATQSDFYNGDGENIDLESSPDNVKLAMDAGGQYYPSGNYELIIDMGQQPERIGSCSLIDDGPWTAPMGIAYEAWASETGKFAGEEISLGAPQNGDAIPVKTRFYKVRTTFTPNAALTQSPVLNRISISFPV